MTPRGLLICRLAALAAALYGVAPLTNWALREPERVGGAEAYWIAQTVAAGKGFAMPEGHRWLFDSVDNNMFLRLADEPAHPTAWSDPLYTYTLAAIIKLSPNYQLWAALLNIVLMVVALLLAYAIAERLRAPVAGLIAVLFLINVNGFTQRWHFGMANTQLAAALVAASALGVVWYLEAPSVRRSSIIGLLLGITTLACPAAQLFIPGTALAFLAFDWRGGRQALLRAAVVGAVALVVILPWTIRNLLVLDKPVPVRTGFGQIAFVGTVALGGVLDPSTLRSQVLPPYQEGSTRRAVKKLLKAPFREIAQLEKFQLDYARELGGPGYENLNEAGRDDWFLKEAKAFLVGHPMLSMKLGLAKLEAFVRIYGRLGMVVCFLAAFGAIILFRTRAIVVLAVWVLGFVVPFLVAVCYYARYRSPIEPVMAVIAGLAIWSIVRTFIPAARRLELAPGAAT